ncbi:MAG: DNA-directed RNA polymerase subunit H [Candidatus Aenigmatarchaeota archaeon]
MKEVDISKHKLMPKHTILGDAEKQELLKRYNITLNHLPRMLIIDPMSKVLDAKAGDVVKIVRDSPTAGKAVYYRVVVRGAFK